MSSWIIFIALIIFSIIRSKAKNDELRRKKEADELRRRRQNAQRSETTVLTSPVNKRTSKNNSRDIFRELFNETDFDPLVDLFDEEEKRPKPSVPVYEMGQGTEGAYGMSSQEGAAYDAFDRTGSLDSAIDIEGHGLGNNYGQSLSVDGNIEGRKSSYDNKSRENISSNKRTSSKSGSSIQGIFNGKLTKKDIVHGLVMAEILGPPRSRKAQIR